MQKFIALLAISVLATISLAESLFPGEDWESNIVDLGNSGDDIFYILYRCRNATERGKRLIVWFQGGPGCSGFIANMMENGPYIFTTDMKLVRNPHAWNSLGDLLYIDQPVGTGFSRMRGEDTNCLRESCVARNMYSFFVRFVTAHPEYRRQPIYLFGQSYAGQYIPAVAAYMVRAMNPDLVVKGVGIGNGLEDFALQLGTHPTYGYLNGLLSFPEALAQQVDALTCQASLLTQPSTDSQHKLCLNAFEEMGNKVPNPNDIREPGGYNQTTAEQKWLQRPDVLAQLNVRNRSFSLCNVTIYKRFINDMYYYTTSDLTYLVQSGVDVMLYHGDKDAVCNWLGGKLVTERVQWDGKTRYNAQSMRDLTAEGKVCGQFKRERNLAFVRIYDAGHFSPYNQPVCALTIAQWLINSFK